MRNSKTPVAPTVQARLIAFIPRLYQFALLCATLSCAGQVTTNELPPVPAAVAKPAKVRTFAKACPDCHTLCTSTNYTTLLVGDGAEFKRQITVFFECPDKQKFWGTITETLEKTPMVEVTQ